MNIDHNIPLPPRNDYNRRYPFNAMAVGDSILVDNAGRRAAYKHGYRHGWKFAQRAQEDGRFRVWRVA